MKNRKRIRTCGRQRKQVWVKNITLPRFNGDLGTGTNAAKRGTEILPVLNAKGENPNNVFRRRRKNVILGMNLTMRQQQAALEIEEAYCGVGKLSSGSPLKARVDSSFKPDATIDGQVDAISRLVRATKAVRKSDKPIVDHVCLFNQPLRTMREPRRYQIFRECMDRVADHLHY